MVKFQIMSDLHIETLSNNLCIDNFVRKSADILILAGDIGRVHKYEQLERFLKDLCPRFEIVLYVLGNHEYYSG
jgi:predicted phosphodiesterase